MSQTTEFTGFLYDQGDRIQLLKEVLSELGHPDTNFSIIHVCGTNGKGSTAMMIGSILQKLQFRVGLFTSPFIGDVTNGIQINQRNISSVTRQALLSRLEQIMSSDKFAGQTLSEFEAEFVAAMMYFSDQHVDYVVLECGLGGELDATNAVTTTMYSIFTKIGLDHIGILGNNIEEIATTKSKIIREGNTTIVAPDQRPAAFDVLAEEVRTKHAKLLDAGAAKVNEIDPGLPTQMIQFHQGSFEGRFKFGLQGTYQVENVSTVVTWLIDFVQKQQLAINLDQLLTDSLGQLQVPGRFEMISSSPKIIVDGAHNLDAISAFVDTVGVNLKQQHKVIITGFLKDKDYRDCVKLLTQIDDVSFRLTHPDNPKRALSVATLQATFADVTGAEYPTFADPITALTHTMTEFRHEPDTIILVVGSFYLLNPIRRFIKDRSNDHE